MRIEKDVEPLHKVVRKVRLLTKADYLCRNQVELAEEELVVLEKKEVINEEKKETRGRKRKTQRGKYVRKSKEERLKQQVANVAVEHEREKKRFPSARLVSLVDSKFAGESINDAY